MVPADVLAPQRRHVISRCSADSKGRHAFLKYATYFRLVFTEISQNDIDQVGT